MFLPITAPVCWFPFILYITAFAVSVLFFIHLAAHFFVHFHPAFVTLFLMSFRSRRLIFFCKWTDEVKQLKNLMKKMVENYDLPADFCS
jgi:hypothetical protein